MSTNHSGGNIQNAITLEEHVGELNAKRVSLVSAATIYAVVSADIIIGDTIGINGNITISDSKGYIGLTTASLGLGTQFIGLTTVVQASSARSIVGNLTLSDPKAYIGLVSVSHAAWADPKTYIGLTTTYLANMPSLSAGVAGIGFATVNVAAISAGINSIGFATVYNLDPLLRAGEDQTNDVQKVEQQFSYATHVANSTAAVKGASGFLHSITIGAISCPTITVWDNTVPSGTYVHRFYPDSPRQTYFFDAKFTTGLTVDALAGAAPQLSISYR